MNSGIAEIRFYHFDYLGSTRWIIDETGKPQYGFRYGTYGEFLSVWRTTEKTPEELELADLTVPVRFLYNGELGVVTDDNSLLYMRQRYYDTEIKRFINQDILTGSIGDSQSLNRYAYVQGNPVNFSDPFGLSPFERLRQAFRPLHAVLNIAGIIPGPVGMLASLAQAGLYGLEGNSALAAHYLSQSLMIGLAGPVGGAVLGALSKMGPAAKVILGTVLGAQSLYTAGVAGINLYNSASKIADGLLNGDMSWLDAFCEGSMALNSAAGIYYSLKGLVNSCELTLKGLDDVAAMYAAKQEAWYREHVGYTTDNLGNIQESGASVMPQSVAKNRNIMVYVSKNVDKGGSESVYIPRDSEGNPIPLKKQRINGQDIPLPDPAAEGRPHTVLGGKVSSETGEVYRQSATFPGGTWPSANGYDVPWSEVHWTDHGTSQFHTNPHEHIFEYNPDKGGWIRKGPSDF